MKPLTSSGHLAFGGKELLLVISQLLVDFIAKEEGRVYESANLLCDVQTYPEFNFVLF